MENKQVQRSSFLKSKCHCGARKRGPSRKKCNNVYVEDPVEKPDLDIYSQLELIRNGQIPNYDSPDIVTNSWRPFRLRQEASVKIRNLSPTVPAINALVHYATSDFGIGTEEVPRISKVVNVPANSEIELLFPLDQETLNGDPRVGVHIQIEHPHDPNLGNNYGSQVHDGGFTTESGRNFTIQIPVINNVSFNRQLVLNVMPTDMITSLSFSTDNFGPFEQKIVNLTIEVPNHLHGTASNYLSRAVTLAGRLTGGETIGGITRLIRIDD